MSQQWLLDGVRARLSNARISAQKVRLVADQIRKMPVEKAFNLLTFSPKKAAKVLKKLLRSVVANAEHNNALDVDELKVVSIYVDEATSLKRSQARAKGRGNRIEKPNCHITIIVAPN